MMRQALIPAGGLLALIIGLAVYGWSVAPPDAQIPVHWGIDGTPDRYGSRLEAFGVVPVLAVLISAVLLIVPVIDPRRRNIERSPAPLIVSWLGMLAFMAVMQGFMVLVATDRIAADGGAIRYVVIGGISALFIAIGNVLPKARPNWFVGVRTPWTLSSDYSWDRTHRLSGWLFVLIGVAGFAAAFAPQAWLGPAVIGAGAIAIALVSVVMSYVWWSRDPDRARGEEA